jgi:hypothetical protein
VGVWESKRACWQTVSDTDAEVLAMRAPSSRRVSLIVVVSAGELAERLRREGQDEWCTRVRLGGLLLLVDLVIRNHSPQGYSIPADLAHGYVSAIHRRKLPHTVREPLAILCRVGILKRVRRAIDGWHLKIPASYTLGGEYLKRRLKLDVGLPPYLSWKRLSAFDRRVERLNGRYPFRERGAPRIGRQSPCLLQAGSRAVPKEKPLPQKTLPLSKGINSVHAQIDTGPPKSRKAPRRSLPLDA